MALGCKPRPAQDSKIVVSGTPLRGFPETKRGKKT
jgi:hypothetical protein